MDPTLNELLDEVFDETVVKCLGECSTLDWVVVAAERTLFSDLSEAKEGWNNQKKFFARPGDAANSYVLWEPFQSQRALIREGKPRTTLGGHIFETTMINSYWYHNVLYYMKYLHASTYVSCDERWWIFVCLFKSFPIFFSIQ